MKYLLFLLLLTGCTSRPLSVQTDYITVYNLASYYVDSPDPLLYNPPCGQRMLVSWRLPSPCPNPELKIKIRFFNREEKEIVKKICSKRGTYAYRLMNEEYLETGGIKTYKVELFSDGCLIKEWRHQLWVDLIIIEHEEDEEMEWENVDLENENNT